MFAVPHSSDASQLSRANAPVMERLDSRCLLSSIAGMWCGSRTEVGLSGTFGTVTVDLNLSQSGKHVAGTERRTAPTATRFFADILTAGTLVKNNFSLQDTAITASRTTSNYTWLLYTATLQLSPDGQTLSGTWRGSHVHGSMTFQRMAAPSIALNTAGLHHGGGITVHYAISTADVIQPLQFQIYRSSTNHLNASSLLIGTQTISPHSHPEKLTVGLHRTTLLSGTSMTGNKRRPYVIIVVNGNSTVVEGADSINTTFFMLHSF